MLHCNYMRKLIYILQNYKYWLKVWFVNKLWKLALQSTKPHIHIMKQKSGLKVLITGQYIQPYHKETKLYKSKYEDYKSKICFDYIKLYEEKN